MLLAALTGNIASGKSYVARLLRQKGAFVVDADHLARDAVAPGSAGLNAIRARWGDKVMALDGTLDRATLRRIVFANATEREALNAIVHPEVERLRALAVAAARSRGERIVICDIPLLYEKHLENQFDLVMLVDAPDDLRLARLTVLRGLTDDEARAMMQAQLPSAGKRQRADIIIDNHDSLFALESRVDAVWPELLARAARS